MTFKDLFSDRAKLYSKYRPEYPDALFEWVSGVVPNHKAVWDCATGSGQAAKGLAKYFDRVIATDASAEQIAQAEQSPKIEYRVADASDSGLPDHSVDMVTVAQALHWFDLDTIYSEAKLVVRPGGALVVWGYGDPVLDSEPLEKILHTYNRGTIEEYWMPERQIILDGLKTVPFPFREIETPGMHLEKDWSLPDLIGYVRTWSATANYIKQTKSDPVPAIESALAEHWGGNENRRLGRWPLHIRAGYAD
jgi:SAM-dependent methyltransferase